MDQEFGPNSYGRHPVLLLHLPHWMVEALALPPNRVLEVHRVPAPHRLRDEGKLAPAGAPDHHPRYVSVPGVASSVPVGTESEVAMIIKPHDGRFQRVHDG